MPHDTDVRSTTHDRHDALLVAALAAGDVSGTDRDHATALIRTCPDCATLHDDLVAIARATATVPPPIAARPRDYRLTPEQAARLRPGGWRRFVGALAGPQFAFSRPIGIALTTIGLAGLLLANVSLPNLGGASTALQTVGAAVGGSAAPAAVDQAQPGPTSAQAFGAPSPAPRAPEGSKSGPLTVADGQALGAVIGSQAAETTARAQTLSDTASNRGSSSGASTSPPSTAVPAPPQAGVSQPVSPTSSPDLRTVVFALVVVAGLALLVLRRVAQRATSA